MLFLNPTGEGRKRSEYQKAGPRSCQGKTRLKGKLELCHVMAGIYIALLLIVIAPMLDAHSLLYRLKNCTCLEK